MKISDTRFKWIVTATSIVIIAIAGMIIFRPDTEARQKQTDSKLGEYIYIDNRGIVHANRKCSRLNYKGMTSYRERISEFVPDIDNSLCPKCVSDEDYEQLMKR